MERMFSREHASSSLIDLLKSSTEDDRLESREDFRTALRGDMFFKDLGFFVDDLPARSGRIVFSGSNAG